jgi:hypothetical protein
MLLLMHYPENSFLKKEINFNLCLNLTDFSVNDSKNCFSWHKISSYSAEELSKNILIF